MEIIQRARESGRVVPSLVPNEQVMDDDGFGADLLRLLDGSGFHLAPEKAVGDGFIELLKKAENLEKVPSGSDEHSKNRTLALRRCILLAVAGGTPPDSPSLSQAITRDYLDSVKLWLDDILSGSIGNVDLLLHLLSNLVQLPVTKTVIKTSGMGKAIGQIEKHSLCVGTANETAIKDRVTQVKDAWNTSVKQRKGQDPLSPPSAVTKRQAEKDLPSPNATKKIKTAGDDNGKKSSSFSSLLKKVSGSDNTSANRSALTSVSTSAKSSNEAVTPQKATKQKKASKRVKWADHFGGELSIARVIEGEEAVEGAPVADPSVSWSDRRKRDRLREKELLSRVKRAKLLDDEDEEELPVSQQLILVRTAWHFPSLLPDRPDVTKPQLSSAEVSIFNDRIGTIPKAVYMSEYDVPSSPTPLSDVEQALDMTSQSSAVIQPIPFFVPPVVVPAPDISVAYAPTHSTMLTRVDSTQYAPPPPPLPIASHVSGATPEFVQALGLPLFLVGQDTQALQTLASSPSLLSTLVDQNGMYDQARLMTLVQTLSASNAGQAPVMQQTPVPSYQQPPQGIYGPASVAAPPPYGQPPPAFPGSSMRNGFRPSSADGNLHISGYGPSTTEQDIINLFAPYVVVDDVAMKGSFAFVNTSDPANAQRAREALTGALLGGSPVRINPAQRKARESGPPGSNFGGGGKMSGSFGSKGPPPGAGMGQHHGAGMAQQGPGMAQGRPGMAQGVPNIDAVRDDRGNPATKNLFVAGYGAGTTEQQIRDLFAQHVLVIGVVSKGSFTFVNTADRSAAVVARDALGGMMVNGGMLRINFAKETGRLGTSFDLTYGPNTGPNARNQQSGPPNMSYYGRG